MRRTRRLQTRAQLVVDQGMDGMILHLDPQLVGDPLLDRAIGGEARGLLQL